MQRGGEAKSCRNRRLPEQTKKKGYRTEVKEKIRKDYGAQNGRAPVRTYADIVYHKLISALVKRRGVTMGQKQMKTGQPLLVELQNYERQGISIWLEGCPSNSDEVSEAMCIREDITYMRDYVFQSGELSELRFDKITKK